jgi:hypothetical protein
LKHFIYHFCSQLFRKWSSSRIAPLFPERLE